MANGAGDGPEAGAGVGDVFEAGDVARAVSPECLFELEMMLGY